MQRYYFHIRRADALWEDIEGSKLDNVEAARQEAILAARELLAYAIRDDVPPPLEIVVADEQGHRVLTLATVEVLPESLRNHMR